MLNKANTAQIRPHNRLLLYTLLCGVLTMDIYKISIKNEELQGQLPFTSLYFEEQRTAESVINVFNGLLAEGKTLEWECEKIDAMSHKEAQQQFMAIADEITE